MADCACPHHPFGCYDHPRSCKCSTEGYPVTDEMVTAAMQAFEPFAGRLLRYPEKDRWHLNDIQGMREAIKAALAAINR